MQDTGLAKKLQAISYKGASILIIISCGYLQSPPG